MVASLPAFEDGHLFFGDWIGRIYLMDKDTGEIIWQGQSEFPIARPLLQDKRVYLPTRNSLLCLSSETGEQLWSMSTLGIANRVANPCCGGCGYFRCRLLGGETDRSYRSQRRNRGISG